jgi:hypothetical protein
MNMRGKIGFWCGNMKKETKTFGNNKRGAFAILCWNIVKKFLINFEELVYERFCIIFGMVVLGQLICITFVRSCLDSFNNNSGGNYFISSLITSFLS